MDLKALISKKNDDATSDSVNEDAVVRRSSSIADILRAFKKFDLAGVVRKSAHPQASADLNAFLEKMPQTVGQTMLIIVGIVWATAGGMGLYTSVQLQTLTEIRAELEESQALKPIVPVVKDVPVNVKEAQVFVDKIKEIYKGLNIRSEGTSVAIAAKSTSQFGQFREAIGHIQNGGSGWRVSISRFCVGRECPAQPLAASLRINKVSVEKPK